MEYVINDDNLELNEIDEFNSKVRALLIDEDKMLICCYNDIILLPGGSIDRGETVDEAIIRELKEETGMDYYNSELEQFLTLRFYQRNYPKRNNEIKNRLVTTEYFIGDYKGISIADQQLTESENSAGFKLQLVPISELEEIILNNRNTNPRNMYFQKELITVLNYYNKRKEKIKNYILK